VRINSFNFIKSTSVDFSSFQMKKRLGDGNEEEVEYWSENDEQTAADDGEEENENKEEKSAIIDSQNENGKTIP